MSLKHNKTSFEEAESPSKLLSANDSLIQKVSFNLPGSRKNSKVAHGHGKIQKPKTKFRSHTLNFVNNHENVTSIYECYMHHHKRCRFRKYIYNHAAEFFKIADLILFLIPLMCLSAANTIMPGLINIGRLCF